MNIKTRQVYHLLRRDKGITLKELAEHIGTISIQALSQFERGHISLKKENLEAYKAYIDNKEV